MAFSSNIITSNSVICHTCWDNFDLDEQTSYGAGTIHLAHGIVIQELSNDLLPVQQPKRVSGKNHNGSRSFKYTPPVIPLLSMPRKVEPISPNSLLTSPTTCCINCSLSDGLCSLVTCCLTANQQY